MDMGASASRIAASARQALLKKYGWGGRISFAFGSLVFGGFATSGSNLSHHNSFVQAERNPLNMAGAEGLASPSARWSPAALPPPARTFRTITVSFGLNATCKIWLGRKDSNLRMTGSKP